MKKYLLSVLAILFLVSGAYAQSARLRVDVPFDFVVGGTTMHAGSYSIAPIRPGNNALLITSANGEESRVVMTCTCAYEQGHDRSDLVFQVVNGHYFLWQIWTEGYQEGRELQLKRPTAEVAGIGKPEVVVVQAKS